MELAIYGFVARKRRIEPAGIAYEFSIIKDKLALGLSTHPVLKIRAQVDGESLSNWQANNEDENNLTKTDWLDKEDTKYKKYIGRLDPNNAKEQDQSVFSYFTYIKNKLQIRNFPFISAMNKIIIFKSYL